MVRNALAAAAGDADADPAFRALVLSLPSEEELATALFEAGHVPDPDRIYAIRRAAALAIAQRLADALPALRDSAATPGAYSPDAAAAGRRSLSAALLRLQTFLDGGDAARAAYAAADNMTDRMAAFACLLDAGDKRVAASFESEWRHDRLVMDKWFMAQVAHAAPRDAVRVAEALTAHADFDASNPNRFRAVIGGLTGGNPAGFHVLDGSGYAFVADWLLRLDGSNPQTAARMSQAFDGWRRMEPERQGLMRAQLDRIAAEPGLSRDLAEMVARMVG